MPRKIIVDDVAVLGAQMILEREAAGLQEATDEIRAIANATRIPGTKKYEYVLEDESV
jgi:hypothetical protein